MAENSASERSEEATPDRLRKAREEGQIPQSWELPSAILLGALLLSLGMFGGRMASWLAGEVRQGVTIRPIVGSGGGAILGALQHKAASALLATAPFFAIAAAASIFASLLGSGWSVSPKAVKLRLDRISPVKGFKNLFSMRSLVRLLMSLAKLAVIGGVVYAYLSARVGECQALRWATPKGMMSGIASLVAGLLARILLVVFAVAAIDLLYQRRKHKKELRMTKQEVKEERKHYELSPEMKGRIRTIQIEMVRKRMLQEVPNADVIVTNPTHVAVALKYTPRAMDAPIVLAKGGDLLCEKIKEIARAHGVPIVHRPPLARAIFSAVEPGQPIPEALFVAVAEVLAMIYRLRKQRFGM